MIGTSLLFGWAIGCFVFGAVADKFGRRSVMLQSSYLIAAVMIILALTDDLKLFLFLTFFYGICFAG